MHFHQNISDVRFKGSKNISRVFSAEWKVFKIVGIYTILTKNSRVLGISRMDLTPEQTTAIEVRLSSFKSALISILNSAPRCTPPIPPVAITCIPACWDTNMVPQTVVLPFSLWKITNGKSLREHFITFSRGVSANIFISSSLAPTCILPPKIAIVAGTAPYEHVEYNKLVIISTYKGADINVLKFFGGGGDSSFVYETFRFRISFLSEKHHICRRSIIFYLCIL